MAKSKGSRKKANIARVAAILKSSNPRKNKAPKPVKTKLKKTQKQLYSPSFDLWAHFSARTAKTPIL